MSRQAFGRWGAELSDDDFACALALRGVIEGRLRLHPYRGDIERQQIDVDHELEWVLIQPLDQFPVEAAQLAGQWKNIVGQLGHERLPRLQMTPQQRYFEALDPVWLSQTLARGATHVAAISWGFVPPQHDFTWVWPIDIALFPNPASTRLREQLRPGRWSTDFVSVVDATKDSSAACEMLLIPGSAKRALADILAATRLARIHTVVVLGGFEGAPEPLVLLDALRAQARAEAAIAVHVPEDERGAWVENLIIELSHNRPLDAAVFAASRRGAQATIPMIVCARGAMGEARLSQYADRLIRDLRAAPNDAGVTIPPETSAWFNLPQTKSLRVLGDALAKGAESFRWDRESEGATHLAKLRVIVEPALRSTPRDSSGRRIQARVFDNEAMDATVPITTTLRPRRRYAIDLRIGADGEGWVTATEVFPEEKRPLGKRVLTVVFTEPRLCRDPQVATLILPPEGQSDPCRFFLYTGDAYGAVDARITVLYRNRVLQTARLHASVVADDAQIENVAEPAIRLDVEAVVRPDLHSLERRSTFDAALLLNHDEQGTPRLSKFVDGRASYVEIGQLRDVVDKLGRRLGKIAVDEDVYEGLDSDPTKQLLRDLAIDGKALYDGLVGNDVVDQSVACARRIQIISARADEILPLEFCYSRPVSLGAMPCKKAAEGLRNGTCCGEHSDDDDTVVCPLAFWNLSKVIERHAHNGEYRKQIPRGTDYALQIEPVDGRDKLSLFSAGVFAASEKARDVEAAPVDRLFKTISRLTEGNAEEVVTWPDWVNVIDQRKPTLLVLLSHTEMVDKHPSIEIGAADLLSPAQIMPKHVRIPPAPPPLVLLMGCKTVQEEVRFENFVASFRQKGAAIVVGTLSAVLGRHAAATTDALLHALAEASASAAPMTFGDALLDIRRRLVAAQTPMALTIIAFGDADWRL